MKILVPEIATHVMENGEGRNQEILSVDTHPHFPIFVSSGAGENRVILWRINKSDKEDWLTFMAEFTAATFENTVNILRFSPCGKYLACGDSNGLVTILSLKEENCKTWLEVTDERNFRRVYLRGHTMDVQDFAWSPDSLYGASAAMDNFVLVWDILKCLEICRIKEHTHYAQGVAWSPNGKFIATASFDETVRIHQIKNSSKKFTCEEIALLKKPKLFADEFKAPTFCRRLCFSPAWSGLLVTPGGLVKDLISIDNNNKIQEVEEVIEKDLPSTTNEENNNVEKRKKSIPAPLIPATHVFRFSSSGFSDIAPVATLKGSNQPSLAARFHPRPFSLVNDEVEPWLSFVSSKQPEKCRFIFAIATIDSILIYDTQHQHPIAVAEKLHYASFTDLTWKIVDEYTFLIASSRDGCFSVIRFDENELGMIMDITLQPIIVPTVGVEEQIVNNEQKEEIKQNIEKDPNNDKLNDNKLNDLNQQPVIIHLDETSLSSTSSISLKKRRVIPENLGIPPATSSPSPIQVEKPINTLQPRRVTLQNIQPVA